MQKEIKTMDASRGEVPKATCLSISKTFLKTIGNYKLKCDFDPSPFSVLNWNFKMIFKRIFKWGNHYKINHQLCFQFFFPKPLVVYLYLIFDNV